MSWILLFELQDLVLLIITYNMTTDQVRLRENTSSKLEKYSSIVGTEYTSIIRLKHET